MRARIPSLCFLSIVAGLTLAAVSLRAEHEGVQPAAGSTRLIVRAINSDGQPVLDLKPADISIKTDGKQREVVSLEIVTVPAGAAASAPNPAPAGAVPAAAAAVLPPPFATNDATAAAAPAPAAGGREFLILLDEEGIGSGREEPVRKAVAQLLSEASPADAFGILSLRVGGINLAPTTQREAITAAMAKFAGGGSSSESAEDMTCRAKRALGTFTSVLRASRPGRTIIILSPGIPVIQSGIQRMGRANETQTTELCQIRSSDLEELGASAAGSPANAYVLYYAEGLASSANTTTAQQGLENVAGVINAESMRLISGGEKALSRIMKETASYYIATLDGASGAIRRVDARSGRDGVKVMARPAGAPPRAGTATAGAPKAATPREILSTTVPFTSVPLRAAGFLSREGTGMKVITLFEPADPSVKLTAAAVGVVDDKGTLKWQWSAQAADLTRAPMAAAIPVPPGKYRVRVAAISANGAAGSVDYDLDATLAEAPPIKMSTMLLGVSTNGFVPKLVFTPAEEMAVGLLELYGVPKDAKVTTKFELAETETGAPLGEAPGNVAPGPGDDGRRTYGGFTITTLAPGDYVMRIIVMIDDKVVGKATRTLRKTS